MSVTKFHIPIHRFSLCPSHFLGAPVVMKINHQKLLHLSDKVSSYPLKLVLYSVALTNECHGYYAEI